MEKKLYTLKEYYNIYYLALFSAYDVYLCKKNSVLNSQFIERIMLAVTEVNGCPFCSHAHTKMALESGMSSAEIQKMLSGINDDIPKDEVIGIFFSQHYADERGKPTSESWERVVSNYGLEKAKAILAITRVIVFGNVSGIAFSSFINRFKKGEKSDERSNLLYEILIILLTIVFLPFALIHAIVARLAGRKTKI